jgi:hypothetical protein
MAAPGKELTPVESNAACLWKSDYAIRMFVVVLDGECRSCDVTPADLSCGKWAYDAKHGSPYAIGAPA